MAVVLLVTLFWLATGSSSLSQKEEGVFPGDLPLPKPPKKLEEVFGTVKRFTSEQEKEEQEKIETPKPQVISFSEIKEKTQEKIVEGSKEVVREKVVEILKELIDKLTEGEATKGKVCDQVCEEVCREVCE